MGIFRRVGAISIVTVLVMSVIFLFPHKVAAVKSGYYYTSGNKILDSNHREVQWNGLNWFGFETSNFAPHGLWTRNMEEMLDQARQEGYNLIRLPYSNQMFDDESKANGIDFAKNANLKNLKPIEIMDYFIKQAGARGFKIILDRHRPDANGQSELWYTAAYTEERWIADWTMLAKRYKDNHTVIGADLHNEPHGAASWGTGDKLTDWRLAAQRAGNAILKVNSDWLIIVEGVSTNVQNAPGNYWWGGNLLGVAHYPVELQVSHRLVYSAHDYGSGVSHQPWFDDADFPNNLSAIWDKYWGYISKQGIAPVLVGEFGGRSVDKTSIEGKWQNALVQYIQKNQLHWTYWSLNPNSGDTGGLLLDDWKTWNKEKQMMLAPLMKQIDTTAASQSDNEIPIEQLSPAIQKVIQDSCRYDQAPSILKKGTVVFDAANQIAQHAQEKQPVIPNKQFQLLYQNEVSESEHSSIRVGIQLKNVSNSPLSLADITIRYWYTADTAEQLKQQFHVDYAALGQANITGRFVPLVDNYQQSDHYVEIGFTNQAGELSKDKSTDEIKLRWNKEDWSNYSLSNDYSYAKDFNSYKQWNRITVYLKGQLVYGTEPPKE